MTLWTQVGRERIRMLYKENKIKVIKSRHDCRTFKGEPLWTLTSD